MNFKKIIKNFFKKLLVINEYYMYKRKIFWCSVFTFVGSLQLYISFAIEVLVYKSLDIKLNFISFFIFSPLFLVILFILISLILLQIEKYTQSDKKTYLNIFFKKIENIENLLNGKWLVQIFLLVITYFISLKAIEINLLVMFFVIFALISQLAIIIYDFLYSVILFFANDITKEKIINHRIKVENKEYILCHLGMQH